MTDTPQSDTHPKERRYPWEDVTVVGDTRRQWINVETWERESAERIKDTVTGR